MRLPISAFISYPKPHPILAKGKDSERRMENEMKVYFIISYPEPHPILAKGKDKKKKPQRNKEAWIFVTYNDFV